MEEGGAEGCHGRSCEQNQPKINQSATRKVLFFTDKNVMIRKHAGVLCDGWAPHRYQGNRVSSLTLWFERRSTTPGQRAARSHVVCGESNEVSLVLQGMLAVTFNIVILLVAACYATFHRCPPMHRVRVVTDLYTKKDPADIQLGRLLDFNMLESFVALRKNVQGGSLISFSAKLISARLRQPSGANDLIRDRSRRFPYHHLIIAP